MLLVSSIGPVKNLPAGVTTRPPPRLAQSAIAFANAAVLSATPFPTPPYWTTSQSRSGNVGGTIRLKIAGTASHPAEPPVSELPPPPPVPPGASPPALPPLAELPPELAPVDPPASTPPPDTTTVE